MPKKSWLGKFPWSEGIKKRACRYILQRYLGQFLEEKLTLEQLSVDLYNGTGRVTDVSLDVQALNEMGEQQHLPLEFVDGFISEISVSIPWSAIFTEAGYVEVTGLKLTVQPRQRSNPGTSMFESMWSSMTSSMQLAEEYLKQDVNVDSGQPLEGIELFAQTIDTMLARVKIRFLDTVIRLEHVPMDSLTGVAVEISIQNLEYSDEAGTDPGNGTLDPNQASKGYVASAFMTKRFHLEGVNFYTDEFPSRARTFSRSIMTTSRDSTPDSKNSESQSSSAQMSPSQNIQTSPESNVINNLCESNPILFAKLTGRQEIRLKIKQGGTIGPKVELEVTLGSLTLFLSPRQLHVLIELGHGLASPDLEDTSNLAPKTYTEKPMVNIDYSRVEKELIQKIQPSQGLHTTDLKHTQSWSTPPLDEADNEDVFLPMTLPGASSMSNSIASNNISMEDSISASSSISSKSSATNISRHQKRKPSTDADSAVEISQFHVGISSISIILLHEDILTACIEDLGLTRASSRQMQNIAEEFFRKMGVFTTGGYGSKDFEKATKLFLDACQLSHIRLLAAPLVVDGTEKTTLQMSVISGNLTVANLEIVECLIDSTSSNSDGTTTAEFVELLEFLKDNSANSGFSNMTNFKMNFKRTEKAMRHAQLIKFMHPRTTIEIQLEPCKSELDITIVDRISAVLNSQPICSYNPITTIRSTINQQTLFYQAVESPLRDSRIDIKVSSVCHTIKVRFPIPDLRPLHDMNRTPWWKRSVRPDYVTLKLIDAQVHSLMESRCHCLARHEIQCRQMSLSYTENEADIPVEIGRASADEKTDSTLPQGGEGFGWPRMVITIYPKYFEGLLDDSSEGEELEHSLYDTALENVPRYVPSPFSSKRIIHESDTPHSKPQGEDKEDGSEPRDGEELIIPGNRKEMLDFIEEGTSGSRIQLDIGLPCVSVQIPSKHLYELLYNRFNTDLFLWESSVPRSKSMAYMESNIGLDLASTVLQEPINPRYSMCKSGIQHDSNSNSEEEEIFHSVADKSDRQYKTKTSKSGQSMVSLTLNITQGILTMYAPVRDSLQNVIPGQQGELILRVEDATIFSVSSYKGDADLSYVCAMVRNASLNHCGLTTIPQQIPPLRSINCFIPKHCLPTIYQSEAGTNVPTNSTEKDMLTIAVRIQSGHETHPIKTFRVTMGMRNGTLRHRMSSSQESWFTQLVDCLDVVDHPIAGYLPPGVVTELHLHLWDCALDYRPVYLPLRSMITLGSFSVSSNITAQTNTSTLRFIAEDAALFISNKIENIINLRNDYICVMDLGLFELSLRLNDKMCGGAPKVDLRASNNVLHVRTCSDSGCALMQLLTYFANDGDLTQITESVDNISIPSTGDEESLLGDESINMLSKSQFERVNSLIEEAMQESVKGSTVNTDEKSPETENQVEVFFFPDEFHPTSQAESEMCKNPDLRATRGYHAQIDDPDEDFCILGEEAGTGVIPKCGVPEVRWLCKESVRIVDNHFSAPLGKTDFLKAPEHFPSAILRYTLCEMTLVWHMYGGKDFNSSQVPAKKHVTIDDDGHHHSDHSQGRSRSVISGVSYQKMSSNEIHFGSVPNSPRVKVKKSSNWHKLGGPGRQRDVLMELQLNKVRFQHEVYPEHTSEASRQVLLVNEIEIRDRLASSHINKFLYQYSSETKPKQSHANMFVMKAVHVRPDPRLSVQECCLRLSLLPLRLNIDQDSLLFLIDFFSELSGNSKNKSNTSTTPIHTQSTPCSKHGTPTHHPPVMTVNVSSSKPDEQISIDASESSIVDQNLLILLEDELTIKEKKTKTKVINEPQVDNQPIYFRSVIFAPEVLVKLDYHGKRVDLTHGPLAGLLMGLAQLNCSELRLRRLVHRHGLLGFDKLLHFILLEWLQDIKKNQLPGLLGGVGPMHSLVQLFQGIQDLFWLPIEQYRKDGRIVRGLQRGANSFTTSTAMAVLELTSRLVHALQSTAETAYDMVSPGPSVKCKTKGQKSHRKRYIEPLDIREGVTNAYILVKEGLGETATELVRVASEEHEQKGVTGAVGGVLRQIPPTVVKPIILASEATSNVLGGMRSQLVPDARREAVQKWRQDPQGV